jgi:hypothetical protein
MIFFDVAVISWTARYAKSTIFSGWPSANIPPGPSVASSCPVSPPAVA